MENQVLDALISAGKWRDAKSYANIAPHQYFLRKDSPELYSVLTDLIRSDGRDEEFSLFGHKRTYRYFYHGEYKYWAYEILLNRARIDEPIRFPEARMKPVDKKQTKLEASA